MSKSPIPPQVSDVASAAKFAQIIQLIKDNQLATAALLFVAWQIGFFAEAASYAGGIC
jgi:hypothetical protein